MSDVQIYFEDLNVGDSLTPTDEPTSRVQLFRYSAATWNAHRIHYDAEYARSVEGYPDILVHSHLHGAFLTKFCVKVAGEKGRVEVVDLSIRKFAVSGETLTCRGTVTNTEVIDKEFGLVSLAIEEIRHSDGAVCAPGTAEVRLPRRIQPTGTDSK